MNFRLTYILAALVTILVLTSPVQAKMAKVCSADANAKQQLACGKQNLHHARAVIGFLQTHPWAGTTNIRAHLLRDQTWLKRYARSHISTALARLQPRPALDHCLLELIDREGSSRNPREWDATLTNPDSGAYGVPQALPGSKMSSAGADWATNVWTQVKWMKGYVNRRYGGSCPALMHSYAYGWY